MFPVKTALMIAALLWLGSPISAQMPRRVQNYPGLAKFPFEKIPELSRPPRTIGAPPPLPHPPPDFIPAPPARLIPASVLNGGVSSQFHYNGHVYDSFEAFKQSDDFVQYQLDNANSATARRLEAMRQEREERYGAAVAYDRYRKSYSASTQFWMNENLRTAERRRILESAMIGVNVR